MYQAVYDNIPTPASIIKKFHIISMSQLEPQPVQFQPTF